MLDAEVLQELITQTKPDLDALAEPQPDLDALLAMLSLETGIPVSKLLQKQPASSIGCGLTTTRRRRVVPPNMQHLPTPNARVCARK